MCRSKKNQCQGSQFADDLSLWAIDRNKTRTGIHLQKSLEEIEKWCSKWRIKVNPAKTQLVSSQEEGRNLLLSNSLDNQGTK